MWRWIFDDLGIAGFLQLRAECSETRRGSDLNRLREPGTGSVGEVYTGSVGEKETGRHTRKFHGDVPSNAGRPCRTRSRMAEEGLHELQIRAAEQELLAGRCKRAALQREVLRLSREAAGAQWRECHLSSELRRLGGQEAARSQRLESLLRNLRRQAEATQQECEERLRGERAAQSAAESAAAGEEKRLQQQFASELSQYQATMQAGCRRAQEQTSGLVEAQIQEVQQKSELQVAQLAQSLHAALADAGREVAESRARGLGELAQLRSRLASAKAALEEARCEQLQAQKEQDWLEGQSKALRETQGELRLEELKLLDALPRLQCELTRQEAQREAAERSRAQAATRAVFEKLRLYEELRAEHLTAAQELAASVEPALSAVLMLEAPVPCGIGGAGYPSQASDDVDRLLFSGDEGMLSLPPTPPDISPLGTGELPGELAAAARSKPR
ncbi:unnamed protein product [Effrenium voratum]|uniref:Uncharacterized protein n=1 Tax=Effrenium voratum TaxID=2562239 RepID=A0AA36IKR8_9DINO|nr:unnamed protein product [Effrenium voratum]